jgi:hypothetical protein
MLLVDFSFPVWLSALAAALATIVMIAEIGSKKKIKGIKKVIEQLQSQSESLKNQTDELSKQTYEMQRQTNAIEQSLGLEIARSMKEEMPSFEQYEQVQFVEVTFKYFFQLRNVGKKAFRLNVCNQNADCYTVDFRGTTQVENNAIFSVIVQYKNQDMMKSIPFQFDICFMNNADKSFSQTITQIGFEPDYNISAIKYSS